jgi:glutaredoxin 3
MRASLKCLALSAIFLAVLNCSTTTVEERTRSPLSASTAQTAYYPKIVLYTVSWCHHCKEAKEYLTSRKIPFTNLDVEKDESAMAVFAEKYRATAVPLIVIGDDEAVLKGFNREALGKTLEKLKK